MSTEFVVGILVPLGIMVVNFSVGLSLKMDDFKQIPRYVKPIVVNFGYQILILPLMTWLLIKVFDLSTSLAIGMFLLAASPGGTFATFYSKRANGNASLNVTLTAIHAFYGVLAIPVAAYVCYKLYYGFSKQVPLDFKSMLGVILVLIIPILLGVFINEKRPEWSQRYVKKINQAGMIAIVLLLIGGFVNDLHQITEAFIKVGLAVILFNVSCLLIGYYGAKPFIKDRAQQISLSMELGLHNCSIIIPLAMSERILNDIEVAMPSAVFIFTGHILAYTAAALFNRSHPKT